MADGHFPTLISKDRDANATSNPVYVQLSDGTSALSITSGALDVNVDNTVNIADGGGSITVDGSLTVTATQLDIDSLNKDDDEVLIWANTAKDGTGTDYVPLVDADGKLIISNPGGTSYTEDEATPAAIVGTATMMERDDALSALTPIEGDWVSLRSNARGALWVELDLTNDVTISDGGNSITVDGTVAATQSGTWDIGTVTTITNDVNIADGGNSITVDASQLDVDDLNLTDDAVRVSGNTSANSETNPIYVYAVNTVVSGSEIHSYDTQAALASDTADNHDYTVSGTTFLLKSVIFSCSGGGKFEVQSGPLASLTTIAVGFVPKFGGTQQIFFDPPKEVPVTSTGSVRIIRTNREGSAQDVYSTIIGSDVA